ncbi:MAG: nucleotidyl transferase AbiEii/AbiGii toxin family protein [Desulfohalobiaceae bacterium]|nr:nucleotidyl transferase AbiEii/AbiGii toxin family protein [Desulfohalobiaceae bacterium]
MFKPKLSVLPPAQKALWEELQSTPDSFVLYGGTGLSLRLGHRSSVDFDFFSSDPFSPGDLQEMVPYLRRTERLQSEPNTLTCLVHRRNNPVKVSFFGGIHFGRVGSPEQVLGPGIWVASLLDIAATKLKVIQERAEAKDYRDIAALLDHDLTLGLALQAAMGIYGTTFNPMISLRALTYFEDGDLRTLDQHVKKLLQRAVAGIDLGNLSPIELKSKRLDNGGGIM